jgi:cytochrome b6-f complex iron-sulfur subunit
VCLEENGFLAISRRCTHLGCTVPWNAEQMRFICPCHSSTFDIHGNVIDAPAPRALDLFQVTIENNVIQVHTGKRIQRSEFRTEQVVFPKKL